MDLLTAEEFRQGFGSHTPMFSGQTRCVRYYMNFDRALELHKKLLLKEGYAYDSQNRQVCIAFSCFPFPSRIHASAACCNA